MSIYQKVTIICFIIAGTVGYSMFHKKQLDSYFDTSKTPILKKMPKATALNIYTGKEIDFTKEFTASNGVIVHFWGTWCAPCEFELPHFLDYVKKFEQKNVKVVLLAVNDNEKKIKKFLKRFKNMPSNVIVAHDEKGLTMPKFGVVKVPETFLFDKNGNNLLKFVGPQDWKLESFYTRVTKFLAL